MERGPRRRGEKRQAEGRRGGGVNDERREGKTVRCSLFFFSSLATPSPSHLLLLLAASLLRSLAESRGLLLTRNLIFTIFACIISRTGVHSAGISSRDEARGTRGKRESKAFFICERGINPATRDELFHDLPFLRGRVILPLPRSLHF